MQYRNDYYGSRADPYNDNIFLDHLKSVACIGMSAVCGEKLLWKYEV